MVPGVLAGAVFYFILTAVNWGVEAVSSKKYQFRAHGRLIVHCLVAIAFTIFLAAAGGGNWATQMQVSGFILAGCILSIVTLGADKSRDQGKAD